MSVDLLDKYDFHDSLVEQIIWNDSVKTLKIAIDFCNWKQEWYTQEDDETCMIDLIFEGVSSFVEPQLKLNSDQIQDFKISADGTVVIVAYNDVVMDSYVMSVKADTVKIKKM